MAVDYSITVSSEGVTFPLSIAGGKSAPNLSTFPGISWDTRTDSEAGFNTTALDAFITQINAPDSFVSRDGYQVRQNGTPSLEREWASASKPLFSLVIKFMIQDGIIASIDETLNTHANVNFTFTGTDADITVKNLMSMTSGYSSPFSSDVNFNYSDYSIGLLRQYLILVHGTAAAVESYLLSKLSSVGIEDGSILNGVLRCDMSCRDYARIGWLYANQFNWDGTQLLPSSYYDSYIANMVPAAMPVSTDNSSNNYLSGESVSSYGGGNGQSSFGSNIYGSNAWINNTVAETVNRTWPNAPPDTVVFDGHFGTEIVAIIPSLGIVATWEGANQGFTPGTADSGLDRALKLLVDAVI